MSSNEFVDPKETMRRNDYQKPKKRTGVSYVPKPQDRKIVYSYAAYGATYEDIAASLGIDDKTLVKHFKEELETGRAIAKNTIAQKLYQVAVGRDAVLHPETKEVMLPAVPPNLGALIFLAKTRLGWKETHVVENKEVKSGVQIYLPDNGMKADKK